MSALIHNTCSLYQGSYLGIYPVEVLLLVDEYQNTLEAYTCKSSAPPRFGALCVMHCLKRPVTPHCIPAIYWWLSIGSP